MTTIEIDIDPHHAQPETEPLRELEPSSSLRMLVIGDFSGQATGKLLRVDRDNFESILSGFAPHVDLALGNGQLGDAELMFRSLADFEPDNIYRKSELFAPLRDQRLHPLYSEPEESGAHSALKPTPEQIARLTSPGGLLDAIIEKSSSSQASNGGAAAPAPKRTDEFESMVERIVAPYTTPAESEESRRAATERAQRLSLLMAHILHDEQFQALEAAWRGLDMLVHGLDTDEMIHLYILDISKDKLTADLKATADVRGSGVYKALTGRWGLIAGNLAFDREVVSDVEALERVSMLAQALGAPFIAEWLTSRQESVKAQAAWEALRKSPASRYVALALPRFLLRLPYGKDTVAVEGFEFEEMVGEPVHTEYLWGNPAFACALVLGRLYEQQRALSPVPAYLRLGDLPLHVFEVNGEKRARPCTEVLLSDHDCEALLDEGVLPLVAVKGSDTIVFPRMRGIGEGGFL
jgi:type VI secretion system protein ImpC